MNYIATIVGGIGPDVWEKDIELFADDFLDAANQANNIANEEGGRVQSLVAY